MNVDRLQAFIGWPPPFAAKGLLPELTPKRRRRWAFVVSDQASRLERAALELEREAVEGAASIARELEVEAARLERLFRSLEPDPAGARTAARMIGPEFLRLVDQCAQGLAVGCLELEWQVYLQAQDLLGDTAAAGPDLLQQGLRHYLLEQYGEAEERLLRALHDDSTSFGALVTLAFLAGHRGELVLVQKRLEDSLHLSSGVPIEGRMIVLRSLTTLYRSTGSAAKSIRTAHSCLELGGAARDTYALASCLASSGEPWGEVLPSLRLAISQCSDLYARAAIDPVFDDYRLNVHELLGALALQANAELAERVVLVQGDLHGMREQICDGDFDWQGARGQQQELERLDRAIEFLERCSAQSDGLSFGALQSELERLDAIAELVRQGELELEALDQRQKASSQVVASCRSVERRATKARRRSQSVLPRLGDRKGIVWSYRILLYAVSGVVHLAATSTVAFGDPLVGLRSFPRQPGQVLQWIFGWPFSTSATLILAPPDAGMVRLLLCALLAIAAAWACHMVVRLIQTMAARRSARALRTESEVRIQLGRVQLLAKSQASAFELYLERLTGVLEQIEAQTA